MFSLRGVCNLGEFHLLFLITVSFLRFPLLAFFIYKDKQIKHGSLICVCVKLTYAIFMLMEMCVTWLHSRGNDRE